MHLKMNFEKMELNDKTIAVPSGNDTDEYRGVIKLNETGVFIFDHLKQETTEEAIAEALAEEYDAPREQIISDVKKYIVEFEKRGLLV